MYMYSTFDIIRELKYGYQTLNMHKFILDKHTIHTYLHKNHIT